MAKTDFLSGHAAPAKRALAAAGIKSIKQLASYTENDIAALHGIGKNALEKLKQSLIAEGLRFKSK
jgi:DNA-directed RNA polymerase alpha subunit